MTNHDFTYTSTTKPKTPNEIARLAAVLSCKIRTDETDPAKWKPLIDAAPEELRALVRIYLEQHYRAQRHKAVVTEGRDGPVARAEIEKLRELTGSAG